MRHVLLGIAGKSANLMQTLRRRGVDIPSTLLVYDNTVSYSIKVASSCYCKHGQMITAILPYDVIFINIEFVC